MELIGESISLKIVQVSIKERISRVLWNSNIFDFCRSVVYCGTKNRGYVSSLMTDF
jgi:hypothetical protein